MALRQVTGIAAPGGIDLALDYDGFLPIRTTWSGPVSGVVEQVYDQDFRLSTLRIAGVGFPYGYDADSLLVQAGSLQIERDPSSGLLVGTTLGAVSTSAGYSSFGEIVEASSAVGGSPFYATTFTPDRLGRISRKLETTGGTTSTFDYVYDLSGRLTQVVRDGLPVSTLAYDANSNRLSRVTPQGERNATYDEQDRLLT